MKLKFETETIYSVNAFDLNEFIADVYELEEFDCQEGAGNDTQHKTSATKGENSESKYDLEDLKKILSDKSCEIWQVGLVLNDLADRDLIPEGTWLVEVSW